MEQLSLIHIPVRETEIFKKEDRSEVEKFEKRREIGHEIANQQI